VSLGLALAVVLLLDPSAGATSEGVAGIAEIPIAGSLAPATLRFGLRGSGFDQSRFGGTNVALTGMGSALSIGWTPAARLELAAAALASSHHGTHMLPDSIQALGDVSLSGTWTFVEGARAAAALHAGARFDAGTSPFAGYADSASPFADLLAAARIGPLATSVDLGWVQDRSEAVVPGNAELSPAQRAAYGAADGPWARESLAVALPLSGGAITPFAAAKAREYFGNVTGGDATLADLGLRIAHAGPSRTFSIELGVEAPLGKEKASARRPLDPDLRVFGGIAILLPPAHAVASAPTVVEKIVQAPPPPPTTGGVTGTVRDARSGEPLSWVVVDVPSVLDNPILTDGSGVYHLHGLPSGAAQIKIQKPGYASTTVPVTIVAGADQTADATLDPAGNKSVGSFSGDVRSRDGKPVPAKITFLFGKETKSILADGTGKFQVTLPPGRFDLRVEAPGFLTQSKSLEVAAGEQTVFNFVLVPASP
jgi:hypothetical protein